jgi:AraC family transcriptional regulator
MSPNSVRTASALWQYQKRIHRAVNYISQNLDQDLQLGTVARIAGFSSFYFHRLFRAVTGEPVFHFIRRLRLELAATLLQNHGYMPIGHVAVECGFNSQAAFARCFGEHFGRTAREWRRCDFWWHNGWRWEWRSRPSQEKRGTEAGDDERSDRVPDWRGPRFEMLEQAAAGKRWDCLRQVDTTVLRGCHIAYMRKLGPYRIEPMLAHWQRLVDWLDKRGMLSRDSVGIAFTRDNQHIVSPRRCRYDVGIVVDSSFQPDEVLDVQCVPGGEYLVSDFAGRLYEEPLATEYLWKYWLGHRRLQQNYGPVLRRFNLVDWKNHPLVPETSFHYQICIPVKPHGYPLVKPEVHVEAFRKCG